MGQLLLNWLNDDVQLSRRINSFEDDFRNGYLLGQLLSKHSQQLNFHQFIDKDDKASRVNNFSLLLDSFSALRVAFDSNLAMSIINRKAGVAKKVLNQKIKQQLDRTNANHFSRSARSTRTLSPLKKIQVSKDKFDEVNRQHFIKQLNELHPSQKAIIQQRHLRKFEQAQERNQVRAAQEEQLGRQAKLMVRTRNNIQLRDTLKKSQQFRKQWQSENQQKWAANMQVRLAQKVKDQKFKQTTFLKKSQTHFNAQNSALKSMQSDIADFQRRNGLASDSEEEVQESQPKTIHTKKPQTVTLKPLKGQQGQERRLGAVQAQKRRHLREKRRRKMIVEQQKRYQMIEITRRERIMLNTVEQTSKQQKELQYEIWRAWQNKSIIMENCRLQEEKIREKEEVRAINSQFKRDQLLKAQRDEHLNQVNSALHTNTLLDRRNQVNQRKQTYLNCEQMVQHLLTLTEEIYQDCQHRNSGTIDPVLLQNVMLEFMGPAHSDPLQHYVQGQHQWSVEVVRSQEEVPTEPTEENALPSQNVNDFFLGNILKDVFTQIHPPTDITSSGSANSTVVCLLGLDFAGKHTLKSIAENEFGFTTIQAEAVVQQRSKEWMSLTAAGMEVSPDTTLLAQQCLEGKPLSEKLLIGLIADQVKKTPKALLLDFPNSYQQAVDLCAALGGESPKDTLPSQSLNAKIASFSALAMPSEVKMIDRQLRGCGIDFALWIDLPPKGSIDRQLGRRWADKNASIVHIKDDIQPFGLAQGEKAGGLVVRNNFKLKNKEQLREWFKMFGTKTGEEQRVCWEEMKGDGTREEMIDTFKSRFQDILAFKEKEAAWIRQKGEEAQKKQEEKEEARKAEELLKQKCSLSQPQAIKSKLSQSLSNIKLPTEFLEQLSQIWNSTEEATVSSLRRAFKELRQQHSNSREYLASVKKAFLELLSREDGKMQLIKEFQIKFNQFAVDNEDMLIYEHTKEQLHQRVVDLESDLLEIIEEKKDDAAAERSAIMGSGWLEAQYEILTETIFVLVQTEVTRYSSTEQLLAHYYNKKYNAKPPQPLVSLQPQLNPESWAALQAYSDGQSPRVEKMVAQALRIMNREEDLGDDKNKKGGKGAPPKKDDKKGGKGQPEEPKELTPQEIELKKALNTQKAILRHRLNKISTVAKNRLGKLTEETTKLYSDLEDLYHYTHGVETQAILGVAAIFKEAIEEERQIENEVRLNHVQVVQSELFRNFQKVIPQVQPAREQPSNDQITISGLREILALLRSQAEGTKIPSKRLLAMMKQLVKNGQLRGLLCDSWRALSEQQVQRFIDLLNHRNDAQIELKEVMLFLALGSYLIPSFEQLQEYKLALSNYESVHVINKETMIAVAAWFDQSPLKEANVRPFERTKLIKALLFDVFAGAEQNQLGVEPFLESIFLTTLRTVKETQEGQTYFMYAFT